MSFRSTGSRGTKAPRIILSSCALFVAFALASQLFPESRKVSPSPSGSEPPTRKIAVPSDYRGAGTPLESEDTAGELRNAAESFESKEWARGLAALHRALELAISAARRERPRGPRLPEKPETPVREVQTGPPFVQVGEEEEEGEEGEIEEEPDIQPGEEVATSDGILYEPVPAAVRRWLARLPKEAKDAAKAAYEPAAAQALARALDLARVDASRDRVLSELRKTAALYPSTPSGTEAGWALADRALEAGRALEAAMAYRALLETAPDSKTRAALLAHIAVAYCIAGLPRAGREVLEKIAREFPDTPVAVRGEPVLGASLSDHPLFRGLLSRAEGAAPKVTGDVRSEAFAWACDTGTFDGTAFDCPPEALPEIGSRAAWIFQIREQEPSGVYPGGLSVLRGVSLGGRVFCRTDSEIVALSASAGKLLWSVPSEASVLLERYPQPSQFAAARLSLCVLSPPERSILLAIDPPILQVRSARAGVAYQRNALVAYDAATGKLRWRAFATAPGVQRRRELAFVAPPVSAGGRIVALAVQGESVYAVAFSSKGKQEWARRLYTWGGGAQSRSGALRNLKVPLVAQEGFVAAIPGHGLVAALTAAGDLLWISRYRAVSEESGYFYAGEDGGAALSNGVLAVAPADSQYVTGFLLEDGTVLWERVRTGGHSAETILGARGERLYLASSKLLAIDIHTGESLWESSKLDGYSGSAVLAGPRIFFPIDRGICVVDSDTGTPVSKIRILDPRIPEKEPIQLFLAKDRLIAASPSRIFALEPQRASWETSGAAEGRDPFERIRLLRAERRYDEAIAKLEELYGTLRSPSALEKVRSELVETAKEAAADTREARYLSRLLELKPAPIEDRSELLALRIFEAELAEASLDQGDGEACARFASLCLDLASKSAEYTARTQKGMEVLAATYASDALRRLRQKGFALEDPEGEKNAWAKIRRTVRGKEGADLAEEELLRAASQGVLGDLVLRRPHLRATRLACRELVRRASEAKLPEVAAELAAIADRDLRWEGEEKPSAVPAAPPAGLPASEALGEMLRQVGDARLEKAFWVEGAEDEVLLENAPGSKPFPGMLSIAKGKLRLRDARGEVVLERELPRYQDLSSGEGSDSDELEARSQCLFDGERLVLFLPCAVYGFAIEGRSNERPLGNFRLRWIFPIGRPPHVGDSRFGFVRVLAANRPRSLGGVFAGAFFDRSGRPLCALADGSLSSIDLATGRQRWRVMSENAFPSAEPRIYGPWIHYVSSGNRELRIFRDPDAPRAGKLRDPRETLTTSEEGIGEAHIVAGGLAAVLTGGRGTEVIDTESGRPLWKAPGFGGELFRAWGGELWFATWNGLTVRSLWTGREERRLELPGENRLLEVLPLAPGSETQSPDSPIGILIAARQRGRTLRVTRRPDALPVSEDLQAISVNSECRAVSEVSLLKGKTAYAGCRSVAPDGRLLLACTAEIEPEKWYTQILVFDPKVHSVRVLASVEAKGEKALRPAIAIVEGGLALESEKEFGLFLPPGTPEDGKSPKS